MAALVLVLVDTWYDGGWVKSGFRLSQVERQQARLLNFCAGAGGHLAQWGLGEIWLQVESGGRAAVKASPVMHSHLRLQWNKWLERSLVIAGKPFEAPTP